MRRALTALTVLALLVPAPAASAADRSDALLIDACQDEKVNGRYSQQDYRKALNKIPADTDEYTGCRDVIRRAKLAAVSGSQEAGSSGGGSSNGGSGEGVGPSGSPEPTATGTDPLEGASPKERKAVEAASKVARPVRIGDGLVRPGLVSAETNVPTPLLLVLALLAAGGLGAGGWVLYTRVRTHRAG